MRKNQKPRILQPVEEAATKPFLTVSFRSPGLFAIEILAMCPGGSWRTLSEWKDIFGSQSFKLDSSKPVGPNMHLMVWSKQ